MQIIVNKLTVSSTWFCPLHSAIIRSRNFFRLKTQHFLMTSMLFGDWCNRMCRYMVWKSKKKKTAKMVNAPNWFNIWGKKGQKTSYFRPLMKYVQVSHRLSTKQRDVTSSTVRSVASASCKNAPRNIWIADYKATNYTNHPYILIQSSYRNTWTLRCNKFCVWFLAWYHRLL